MAVSHSGLSSMVNSLATLLRNDGDMVLDGRSTLTLPATSLQQLNKLFELHLLSRNQSHGFLALPSHPADTSSLLQLQFVFDMLQKTVSLKLINPPGTRLQSVVKIFPFKSLKYLELKRIPPHCLEGLRAVYSQLEVFTCSKSLGTLEELLSLCGGDLSSALPWLELHTLNFSYNSIACLDQSLSLLNVLKSLDLSHNKIQECAEFLKPLSDLEHLNLGYNCLQRAPTLGTSSRVKLRTLILRNNEMETINGVELLSSLQHLDLAYNFLLEHSQLAPLSLLHCLKTLNLEGNPLYFQENHRICTVSHLSPKAVKLRLKLDGIQLTSSELSVLPKPGQMIIQAQTSVQVGHPSERRHQEFSSGAGELSDSVSVREVGVSQLRRKKSRTKVKVRKASISEPSDTDYEPRAQSSMMDIVLPHQQEIEHMSSFREQQGDNWLRFKHHLDEASSSTITSNVCTVQLAPQQPHNVPNSFFGSPCAGSTADPKPFPSSLEALEILRPPLLSSEPKLESSDIDADQDTESTLQWPSQCPHQTESTLEDSMMNSQAVTHRQSPEAQSLPRSETADTGEELEEDLGVDLCLPLLVGVSSENEEAKVGQGKRGPREVFLRLKQGLMLEVDVQQGQERCRLELDSLARVETTEAAWRRGETEEILPAVELQFHYICKEKRRRCYVLLDDEPQQALRALNEVLSHVVEENNQREAKLRPGSVRLQCLRCRSEFTLQGGGSEEEEGGRGRRQDGVDQQEKEELMAYNNCKGNTDICPECGSDHVVQLVSQSPPSSSTPIPQPLWLNDDLIHLNVTPSTCIANNVIKDDCTYTSVSSSPTQEVCFTTNTTEVPTFFSAQGSSFFIGEDQGEICSLSYNTNCQSKEDLAGSYHYTAIGATPPKVEAQPAGRATVDDLDLLSGVQEVVDHRLKLFLDMDVFEEEEELRSFLKTSAVRFGEDREVPSLLVVSDKRIYLLEMTSENNKGQLSDWLQKRSYHPILELSYLEVGLGSQSIHMEFGDGGVAYTLLVRDSIRCKQFFGILTEIVREMAHKSDSKLKSICTTRLDPKHHLWSLVCADIQADVEDGQMQFFYILAFIFQEDIWMPVTVLATRETLYLLKEDHQWRKSSNDQEVNNSIEPTSGSFTVLETLPISCVSSIYVWPSEQSRVDIKLYDEMMKQERTWCVRSESKELLQGLQEWVRVQWEAMFGVKLQTSLEDSGA